MIVQLRLCNEGAGGRHSPPGGADVGEFGENLRKQREQLGITLESVSNTTKIGTRMLKALEDERFDQLPGGVFNKGFVRAYARHIGLDPEEAVTGYLAALRESQAQAQDIMPEFRPQRPEPAGHSVATTSPGPELAAANIPRSIPKDLPKDPRPNPRANLRAAVLPSPPPREIPQPDRPQPVRPELPPDAPAAQSQRPPERMPKELPRRKLIEQRPAKPNLTPGIRIPWGIVAAVLLLVALVLAFLSYHPRAARSAASPSAKPAEPPLVASTSSAPPQPSATSSLRSAAPTTPPAAPAPSAVNRQPAQPSSSPAHSPTTASTTSPVATPPSTAPAARIASSTPSTESRSAGTGSTGTSSAGKEAPSTDASTPAPQAFTTAATLPAVPAKTPAAITLSIRAEETSWVAITADGKPFAHETLIAPAGTSVRATREIEVRAGNAAGLVFVLNGKPLPRQGEPGEARTFIFDATGVHVILPTTPTTP